MFLLAVKGMQLVRELERDVKTAAIICMVGNLNAALSMEMYSPVFVCEE